MTFTKDNDNDVCPCELRFENELSSSTSVGAMPPLTEETYWDLSNVNLHWLKGLLLKESWYDL